MELVKAFEKVNGVPVHYKLVDRRPGDVATCYANADKAWKELNWKTEKTIERHVSRYVETGNRKIQMDTKDKKRCEWRLTSYFCNYGREKQVWRPVFQYIIDYFFNKSRISASNSS